MWPFEQTPPMPHAGLTNMTIPTGERGTAATIHEMQKLVSSGKRDQKLRQLLSQILNDAGCAEKDYLAYARAVFYYCRDQIRYVRDPFGVELVETPMRVVRNKVADCDSICILFCALCEQCGLPCRFVTIKTNPNHDVFTHVYSQVNVDGKWYSADCTMKQFDFGWTPPEHYPAKMWPASLEGADMSMGAINIPAPMGLRRNHKGQRAPIFKQPFPCDTNAPYSETNKCGYSSPLGGYGEMCTDTALGCADCGGTCGMAELACCGMGDLACCGMGDLGAMPSVGEVELMINQVLNGQYADELNAARNRMGADLGYTFDAQSKAQYEGSEETLAAANAARAAVLKENASLQKAIDAYNKFAQDIQTRSGGYYKPTQLGALPLVPIAVISAALVTTAYAFNTAMSAWRGDANASRGYLDQLSSALDSAGIAVERTGGAISQTTTTFAAVGVVALLGFLAFQKWGKK